MPRASYSTNTGSVEDKGVTTRGSEGSVVVKKVLESVGRFVNKFLEW